MQQAVLRLVHHLQHVVARGQVLGGGQLQYEVKAISRLVVMFLSIY